MDAQREAGKMRNRTHILATAVALIALIPAAALALTPYYQDFESLNAADPQALANDGWVIYGNVFSPEGAYLYGYGVFPAPNHNLAFSQIVPGEGGDAQGLQQLSIFSDYENADHANGNLIESNVFQEQTITVADVGTNWRFSYEFKRGNLEGATTAFVFIKTLDPSSGYATTNYITEEVTASTTEWSGGFLDIAIDVSLVGQLLQIGFVCTASNYEGSGMFYDNLAFEEGGGEVAVPDQPTLDGVRLGANYPNPFNPMTRIDVALDEAMRVDVSVFDVAGRRVTTLVQGDLPAGEHSLTWDGRDQAGRSVPAGMYRYAVSTANGVTSRSMVLVK
jgi:hypothetical protein